MKKWIIGIVLSNLGFFFLLLLALVLISSILTSAEASSQESKGSSQGCSVVASGTLDEETLNKFLETRGVFKGTASSFIKYGETYNVDPALVVAIAMHETGNGISRMVKEWNNPGGLMGDGPGFQFSTLDKGIEAMIKNLSKNYISLGLNTPEKIQPKYAPVGASNDGLGLNKEWLNGVNGFLKQLGGLSTCASNEGTGKYMIPVDNPNISSGFVDRVNPVTGVAEHHKGLDFAQPIGSSIKAADDGLVVYAQMGVSGSGFGGYGNVVLIEHAKNKEWTLYGHQSKLLVKAGQKVKKGDVIGQVGSTGQSTGPHLHFEIRKEKMGGQIDPAPVLGVKEK
ncbi:peptidase M23 [Listeria monocytogenes]|nr:peptidase M23 [Listeria monocytogenes]EAE8031215.1 peptidase M23 [Listeria monocytogenes]EAE8492037.1 peptidase M23 [Listeria monocytogenes]EAE9317835.1 peptidase M23 [Listeria monocytogenes]EAF2184176.1 peptidase M23 [Listeria monocytogenes]